MNQFITYSITFLLMWVIGSDAPAFAVEPTDEAQSVRENFTVAGPTQVHVGPSNRSSEPLFY